MGKTSEFVLVEQTRTATHTPDGLTVIAREYNTLVPHPHPKMEGRLVATRGVNQILVLEEGPGADPNGGKLYECDNCGKTAQTGQSIVSHMPSHNPAKFTSPYDHRVLRRIMDIAHEERAKTTKDYCVRTIARLDEEGIKPLKVEKWTDHALSSLYLRWKDDPRYRVRKPRTTTRRATTVPGSRTRGVDFTQVTVSPAPSVDIRVPRTALTGAAAAMQQLGESIADCAAEMSKIINVLRRVAESLPNIDVTDLQRKAQRYDELASMLRDTTTDTRDR